MIASVRPTYQAVVDQAVAVTGAISAWLLGAIDNDLMVLATAGTASTYDCIGKYITPTGAQGYVLSSGQPATLIPPVGDTSNRGAAGCHGVPRSVLAAPCGTDTIYGVLELADKVNHEPFSFEDIEAVSTLAAVAGAALSEDDTGPIDVVSPHQLTSQLERLASGNPRRYADTARLIESLLGFDA